MAMFWPHRIARKDGMPSTGRLVGVLDLAPCSTLGLSGMMLFRGPR